MNTTDGSVAETHLMNSVNEVISVSEFRSERRIAELFRNLTNTHYFDMYVVIVSILPGTIPNTSR